MSVLYTFFEVITSFGFSIFFTLKDFDVMILGYLLFYNWNRKKSENLISKLNSLAFKLIFFWNIIVIAKENEFIVLKKWKIFNYHIE